MNKYPAFLYALIEKTYRDVHEKEMSIEDGAQFLRIDIDEFKSELTRRFRSNNK